ncbi:hypothetical protein FQZ97_1073620 [compost metagenome]
MLIFKSRHFTNRSMYIFHLRHTTTLASGSFCALRYGQGKGSCLQCFIGTGTDVEITDLYRGYGIITCTVCTDLVQEFSGTQQLRHEI